MSTPVKGPSTYPQNPHIGIAQMRLGSTDAVTCKQKNTYRLLAPGYEPSLAEVLKLKPASKLKKDFDQHCYADFFKVFF